MVKVSPVEYWLVDREVSSDSLKLQLFWETAASATIHDCSKITIAHWKNSQWNEEPSGLVSGSSCAPNGSGSLQTTGYISSFSPFTFGGDDDPALPIELVSFTASSAKGTDSCLPIGKQPLKMLNNDYFTVERSADGEGF